MLVYLLSLFDLICYRFKDLIFILHLRIKVFIKARNALNLISN